MSNFNPLFIVLDLIYQFVLHLVNYTETEFVQSFSVSMLEQNTTSFKYDADFNHCCAAAEVDSYNKRMPQKERGAKFVKGL